MLLLSVNIQTQTFRNSLRLKCSKPARRSYASCLFWFHLQWFGTMTGKMSLQIFATILLKYVLHIHLFHRAIIHCFIFSFFLFVCLLETILEKYEFSQFSCIMLGWQCQFKNVCVLHFRDERFLFIYYSNLLHAVDLWHFWTNIQIFK